MPSNFIIKRSDRRTAAIEIRSDLSVTVRVPKRYSDEEIRSFVEKHGEWIAERLSERKRKNEALRFPVDTPAELLKNEAARLLPPLVEKYSALTGLKPRRIRINSAKTRFGSCSPDGGLNFSYRLMLYPIEAIEYVVLHEIAHIKHKNHQKRFYAFIERYMPDWKERVALLK